MDKSLKDFYRGDAKSFQVIVKKNGEIQDIVDWSAKFFLKNNETDDDSEAILEKDGTPSSPTTDGTFVFLLTETDTTITRQKYFYTVKVFDPAGNPFTVLADNVRCK